MVNLNGYSGTPLWKKLGFKDGLSACAIGAPSHYRTLLDLPDDISIRWSTTPSSRTAIVHLFATRTLSLATRLTALRRSIAPDAAVWVSWPKKTSGVATDITENVIRDVALPLGFVDIKVCAVDEVWSGLKLTIRRELRRKP